MKRHFWPLAALGFLTSIVLASPIRAADLAKPAEPAKTVELAEKPPFHGLYVGALVGHATGVINDADGFKFPRDGYTASGLIGYNHRLPGMQGIVLGVEGDLGLTGLSGATNAGGFTVTGTNKIVGSLRGRIGYALSNSTMLFGTAGLATTNSKLAVESVGSDSTNRLNGYVFGGGVDIMAIGNMGLRIEYLRYQWRDQSYTIGGQDTGKLGSHDDHVRAGLIVRLN